MFQKVPHISWSNAIPIAQSSVLALLQFHNPNCTLVGKMAKGFLDVFKIRPTADKVVVAVICCKNKLHT
jgi:hypothetical protein